MKLTGSRLEEEIRARLIQGQRALMMEGRYPELMSELTRHFGRIESAFFLGHTPDQGEDCYTLLVNGDQVASCEIPRVPGGCYSPVEAVSVHHYARGLRGKDRNLALLIARALADEISKTRAPGPDRSVPIGGQA